MKRFERPSLPSLFWKPTHENETLTGQYQGTEQNTTGEALVFTMVDGHRRFVGVNAWLQPMRRLFVVGRWYTLTYTGTTPTKSGPMKTYTVDELEEDEIPVSSSPATPTDASEVQF